MTKPEAPNPESDSQRSTPLRWRSTALLGLTSLILVLLAATWLLRCSAHKAARSRTNDLHDGVLVEVREFETNANGLVRAIVAVRNDTATVLEFGYRTQILTARGWAHTNGNLTQFRLRTETDPLLPPNSERLVAVPRPATGDPWRVVALCWTPPDNSGQRGKTVRFFSPEQSP
jgi:hypothetical protein